MAERKLTANKRHLSRGMIVTLVICAYLFGLLLGNCIIWLVPFISHENTLTHLVQDRLYSTLYNFNSYDEYTFGTEYYVYDDIGRRVTAETVFSSKETQAAVKDYLPLLFSDGSTYRPVIITLNDSTHPHSYAILAGTTMEGQTGIRFAGIVLMSFPDMSVSVITYCILYTIIFLAAAVFVNGIHRQHVELDTMRKDFIANVGHELKTPITAIKALTEVIYDGIDKSPEATKKYSGSILRETDKLELLVNDILELSRLQSGRTPINKEVIDAADLLPPVVDRYTMLCMDSGITLETGSLQPEKLPKLYTDFNRITTVFNVLLDNAIKFTGSGGTVSITQTMHPGYVVISVKDNGPGIAEKDIPYIFNRFYKADVTHNSKGSGLGLSIADEIIRRLGERIWVESIPGKGAEFFFTISYHRL